MKITLSHFSEFIEVGKSRAPPTSFLQIFELPVVENSTSIVLNRVLGWEEHETELHRILQCGILEGKFLLQGFPLQGTRETQSSYKIAVRREQLKC